MTTPLIRAEIRNWRRKNGEIDGHVFNDQNAIFDDGEYIIVKVLSFDQGSTFALVRAENGIFKLFNEEKRPDSD